MIRAKKPQKQSYKCLFPRSGRLYMDRAVGWRGDSSRRSGARSGSRTPKSRRRSRTGGCPRYSFSQLFFFTCTCFFPYHLMKHPRKRVDLAAAPPWPSLRRRLSAAAWSMAAIAGDYQRPKELMDLSVRLEIGVRLRALEKIGSWRRMSWQRVIIRDKRAPHSWSPQKLPKNARAFSCVLLDHLPADKGHLVRDRDPSPKWGCREEFNFIIK